MSDIAQRALARNSNNETNVRHYCRNPRCRSKLKVPVENEHHAFCTPGCHTSFYRSRCLVCEDQMRRKSDRQRFGSGHRTCQSEYRRFPHVYELPSRSGYQGSQNARRGVGSAQSTGLKTRLSGGRGSYLIGPHDYPINVIGGYRFPLAPPCPDGVP